MTDWKYNINLTQVIQNMSKLFNPQGRVPKRVKTEMIKEINKAEPLKHILRCNSVGELNLVLNDIYNAADELKVWCGGMPC